MKFTLIIAVTLASFLGGFILAYAGSEHNLSGWAWSETIGWISFNSVNQATGANYGVDVASNGRLSGYAWSEHIGWITFNQNEMVGCPQTPCRADFDKNNGQVTGWARALAADGNGWDGWISLSGTNYGVSINNCGWQGWAWGSEVVGWISFSGTNYAVTGTDDACTDFSTSLNASPSSGFAPLSANLTANVSGGEGTINYTFWWDCGNSSTNVSSVISACGNPSDPAIGAKFDNLSETQKTANHIYSDSGTYTAKVIVERDTRSAENRVSITAQTPPEDFSLSSSNNIQADITASPFAESTKTTISVNPLFGFNSQITLSIESVTPSLSGAIYHWKKNATGQESSGSSPTITLNSGQFSNGADFWADVPRESAPQEYTIRIKGDDGEKTRFVDIKLNTQSTTPTFEEI